jgi:hypothetical protein
VNAYLDAVLKENIYMNLPVELYSNNSQPVKVKLNKCLYGLKQAGERWNHLINEIILSTGFSGCVHDKCIYYYSNDEVNTKAYISLFVDDVLSFSNNQTFIDKIKAKSAMKVTKLTSVGEVREYIGIDVKRYSEKRKISLSQFRYADNITSKETKENESTKAIPLPSTLNFTETNKIDSNNPIDLQIGSIRYLADHTRNYLLACSPCK